jgi:hypothetical protein
MTSLTGTLWLLKLLLQPLLRVLTFLKQQMLPLLPPPPAPPLVSFRSKGITNRLQQVYTPVLSHSC